MIGVVLEAFILSPMALFGPDTRTNNVVSSSARFGVVGRALGPLSSLLTAVAFFSISVWVSGDAIVGAAHRLGLPGGEVLRAISYGVIAVAVSVVCVCGCQCMLLVTLPAMKGGASFLAEQGSCFIAPHLPGKL